LLYKVYPHHLPHSPRTTKYFHSPLILSAAISLPKSYLLVKSHHPDLEARNQRNIKYSVLYSSGTHIGHNIERENSLTIREPDPAYTEPAPPRPPCASTWESAGRATTAPGSWSFHASSLPVLAARVTSPFSTAAFCLLRFRIVPAARPSVVTVSQTQSVKAEKLWGFGRTLTHLKLGGGTAGHGVWVVLLGRCDVYC